jgi:hypothetical protein
MEIWLSSCASDDTSHRSSLQTEESPASPAKKSTCNQRHLLPIAAFLQWYLEPRVFFTDQTQSVRREAQTAPRGVPHRYERNFRQTKPNGPCQALGRVCLVSSRVAFHVSGIRFRCFDQTWQEESHRDAQTCTRARSLDPRFETQIWRVRSAEGPKQGLLDINEELQLELTVLKRTSEQHEPQTSMRATTITKARPAWKATCRVHGAEEEGIASVDSVGALLCAHLGMPTPSLHYICPLHDFTYLHNLVSQQSYAPRFGDATSCFPSLSFSHTTPHYRLSAFDTEANPLAFPQRALIPWLSIKFGVHRDCRPWVEIFDREGARLKRRTAGWRRAVCTSEFAFGFGFALCKLWLLCAKEKVGVGVISAL